MQGRPEDIAASWASDGSAAEPADLDAVEAARRWCGLEALQEDDDMILPLYDAMAKMETWWDFGGIFMGFDGILAIFMGFSFFLKIDYVI